MMDFCMYFHIIWKIPFNKHYIALAEWFWVLTGNARNETAKVATLLDS
jgi:hypothetical protein